MKKILLSALAVVGGMLFTTPSTFAAPCTPPNGGTDGYCLPSNPITGTAGASCKSGESSTPDSACNGADRQDGICCYKPKPVATSPVPAAGGSNERLVSPAPGGSGTSNRAAVTGSSSTGRGLYIPRGSEVGLSDQTITALIVNLLNWLLYIFGFVAIIAFVIAGIQYLLAAGSDDMAKKAKENMQYAIVGVLVALSALIIIRAIQAVLGGFRNF